jgi:lactoylglutathione lyase
MCFAYRPRWELRASSFRQQTQKGKKMVRLEHIAMWVRDLDAMSSFYSSTFGGVVGPLYQNPTKQLATRFVQFGSGARIELMTTGSISLTEVSPGAQRMGLAHLAMSLGSEEAVDELTSKLKSGGAPVLDGPRWTGDGYYESVVLDPEGNRIELTA